jgi:protein-S-isoprenylcysteine O-methyltransferase Ste14
MLGAMSWVHTFVPVVWFVFWGYWLISAVGAKHGSRRGARFPAALIVFVVVVVLAHTVGFGSTAVHDAGLQVTGVALLLLGLALAVWARLALGRNWGMPMTAKDQPELVTWGPYRWIRHPIYSGLLLALIGTALAINLLLLIAVLLVGSYFIHSARVEERLMKAAFPTAYPRYMRATKMLVPFVL